MKRISSALGKLNWRNRTGAVLALWAIGAIALPAQTLSTLFSFDGIDGGSPNRGLVQATNGDFYGTTFSGANGQGSVFEIAPGGSETTLYSFCAQSGCPDGAFPDAGLVLDPNGDLYGTTQGGGGNGGSGTAFKINPSGTLATVYRFCAEGHCAHGQKPEAALMRASNGDFYGTTYEGGAHLHCNSKEGCGTVFKLTPSGKLTTLYSFCAESSCIDGNAPNGGLVQAPNGDFYGTTSFGGAYDDGTVFQITPSGTLTTLYSFCAQSQCADGQEPLAGLVLATDGNFYGTTFLGGADGAGTFFQVTASGTLTTLYSFCTQSDCTDGKYPEWELVQGTDGNFYGATDAGGAYGAGTIFQIANSGTLTTLYTFCAQNACPDGSTPSGGLLQATDGNFYGTTHSGGASNHGTVFRMSAGLGPFVRPVTTSGKAGSPVKILGTDLAGATSVTFNGTPAKFTIDPLDSLITATVPAGATTGNIQVVTPTATLLSNVPFQVP
jgi:uncharacterized repeat protein (TIGR03803 family)